MSSREKILSAITANKLAATPLPIYNFGEKNKNGLAASFASVLTTIGGNYLRVTAYADIINDEKKKELYELFYIQAIGQLPLFNANQFAETNASALDALHTVYIKGELGVAENGSVWVPEKNMVNRLLPFICQHLIVVIDEKKIVATMHDAYDLIKADEDGYGVFIAGPSKTADIEQSLVIGAHGPLSLQVVVVG